MAWSFFVRYLMSKRAGSVVRTIARIAIVAVGVGLASWVLVSSVMNGFNETIRVRHLSVEPHVLVDVLNPQAIESEIEQVRAVLSEADIKIESIIPASQQDVILRTYDGLFGGGVLKGISPHELKSFYERTQRALQVGRSSVDEELPPLAQETWNLEKDEVIVGVDLARTLGVFEGDPIVVLPPETLLLPKGEAPPYAKLKVKSLLSTRLPDVDGQWIFYNRDIKTFPLRAAMSRKETIEVRLQDPYQDETVKEILEDKGYALSTWRERNKALFFALRLERWAMSLFLTLSTLITCFAIVSVLVLLIYQKRQEIGILMAMGLSQKDIKTIFIGIGLCLSLIGMGGGVLVGLVFAIILDRYPLEILPDIYYDATIPASIDPLQISAILFFSVVLALLASWMPVKWSLKGSASECLRRG